MCRTCPTDGPSIEYTKVYYSPDGYPTKRGPCDPIALSDGPHLTQADVKVIQAYNHKLLEWMATSIAVCTRADVDVRDLRREYRRMQRIVTQFKFEGDCE